MQQLQFFRQQLTPVFAGNVQHAERYGTRIDGHTGVKAQTPGGGVTVALGILQPATAEYIDVGCPFEAAFQEGIQAETVAGHAFPVVGKVRRQ